MVTVKGRDRDRGRDEDRIRIGTRTMRVRVAMKIKAADFLKNWKVTDLEHQSRLETACISSLSWTIWDFG